MFDVEYLHFCRIVNFLQKYDFKKNVFVVLTHPNVHIYLHFTKLIFCILFTSSQIEAIQQWQIGSCKYRICFVTSVCNPDFIHANS